MTEREKIINRLVENNHITPIEAELLKTGEFIIIKEKEYLPFPKEEKRPFNTPKDQWIQDEMERRMRHVDNCGCNPKNGGSGVCGCVLGGPFVTYCSSAPAAQNTTTFNSTN